MTTLTPYQAAKFVLIPGRVERLERQSQESGDTIWPEITRNIKIARNCLFLGTSLQICSAILAASSRPFGLPSLAISALITFKAGYELVRYTQLFRQTIPDPINTNLER